MLLMLFQSTYPFSKVHTYITGYIQSYWCVFTVQSLFLVCADADARRGGQVSCSGTALLWDTGSHWALRPASLCPVFTPRTPQCSYWHRDSHSMWRWTQVLTYACAVFSPPEPSLWAVDRSAHDSFRTDIRSTQVRSDLTHHLLLPFLPSFLWHFQPFPEPHFMSHIYMWFNGSTWCLGFPKERECICLSRSVLLWWPLTADTFLQMMRFCFLNWHCQHIYNSWVHTPNCALLLGQQGPYTMR